VKRILQIYRTDIHHIVTNWAALLMIFALIILPSFYAWFNIKASWDPYGNTKGIKVAVVNHDKGYKVNGKAINVGNELVQMLKQNHKLGWTFVSEKDAIHGVKTGKYYASISVPPDFSKDLASITTQHQTKPSIEYIVNEKINAVAPKMTSSGASSIVENISSEFVKTVSKAIFSIFNKLGIELQQDLPDIENFKMWVFKLEHDIPVINRLVNTADKDIKEADSIVKKTQGAMPTVSRIVSHGQTVSNELTTFFTDINNKLNNVEPIVRDQLMMLAITASDVSQFVNGVQTNNWSITDIEESANRHNIQLQQGISIIKQLQTLLANIDQMNGNNTLNVLNNQFSNIKTQLQKDIDVNNQLLNVLQNNEQLSDSQRRNLSEQANEVASNLHHIVNQYDTTFAPAIRKAITQAERDNADANRLLTATHLTIPRVESILNDTENGLMFGKREIKNIKAHLPTVEQKVVQLAKKIRTFEKEENINQLIALLKNNVEEKSDFLKQPVVLKEKTFFHVPNYGSGMTPFYTVLSFWVGAMLLVSLVSVELHDEVHLKSVQIYLGRLLLFLTIAILQSAIVTIGDIFLLNVYVKEKLWFILFGAGISLLFMFIVYTLVSVFGNIGKAFGIILLVLQISASSGTFPIEVTPAFFQRIHPFLPFSYAISLMREALGGMLKETVQTDLFRLLVFALTTAAIGIGLKKPLKAFIEKFVKKAKMSKLFE